MLFVTVVIPWIIRWLRRKRGQQKASSGKDEVFFYSRYYLNFRKGNGGMNPMNSPKITTTVAITKTTTAPCLNGSEGLIFSRPHQST